MNDPSPKRFMFEKSFDLTAMRQEEDEKAALKFKEQDLAAAREQGYAQGFAAGKEAALRELQNQQNTILGNIQGLFERFAAEIWKGHVQTRQAASEIAMAIARKILPEYVRRNGFQELLAAVEGCLAEMINEPRLVLRVADQHFDLVSQEVSGMSARLGYGGKIIILADNALNEYDCRIEWADGGMERSVNLTWSEIEKQLTRHHTATAQHHATPASASNETSSTSIAI